uniref:Uncharacterized protein n=1 Tax=viral metagenome TaxID=1070528 RepID=A0A6C0IY13_9ZZZZ
MGSAVGGGSGDNDDVVISIMQYNHSKCRSDIFSFDTYLKLTK